MAVRSIVLGLVLVSSAQPALAKFCMQPSPPSTFITKPTKPFCAMNRTCTDFDVQMYRDQIDRYYRRLKEYLADADRYHGEAYEYAKCMADLD